MNGLDIVLNEQQLDQLVDYLALIQKWNQTYNLTKIDKTENIEQAKLNLKYLSGRRHRVYTGITFFTNQDRYFLVA